MPIYSDREVRMFESGAIAWRIAEDCEALLPRDASGRARALSWVIAALNSVEPVIMQLCDMDLFHADADWARARRPDVERQVRGRLARLSDRLRDRDWLEDRFTVGDLMTSAVLRNLRHTDLVAEHPALAAFHARCEARPAFARALAAQLAVFEAHQATAIA